MTHLLGKRVIPIRHHLNNILFSKTIMTLPTTQKVIYFEENGDIDKLKFSPEWPMPLIGADDILVKNKYSGVNFIEVYFRKGIYPSEKPYIPGRESAGEVVAVGDNVKGFSVGDKIAGLYPKNFAQYTALDYKSNTILNLGKDLSDSQLQLYAASLLQGLTALTFIEEAYKVQQGDYIFITAAAGGVGLILNQLLKLRGAHTIAVASSDEKLKLAKENGAEFLLNSSKLSFDEIKDEVLKITNGQGVEAVFDSIGKDSFECSLAIVKRKGTLVTFGNASGPIPPFLVNRLSAKNIKLLRPQLFGYIATKEEFTHYTTELFELIDSGKLNIKVHGVYPLEDYPNATTEMEGRKTTGKLVLSIP